jgi:1-acyl-sn-glycerol-3-phosphate acyltransferase
MAIVKETCLIFLIFFYILISLGIRLIFSFFGSSVHLRILTSWTNIFTKFLRFLLKIKIIIEGNGRYLNEYGNFIVSNHLGYLDGIVLGSLFRVIYVSKSEVRKWPLFGWMSAAGETIFIDRKRKIKSPDYLQEATQMLKQKLNVLVFAEGTSTKGERLFPFQSVHFQAPINAQSPILPITITYTKINKEKVNLENRDKLCWYGQIKFYKHLLNALRLNNIEAKVVIHPKIVPASFLREGYSRKELSEATHKIISESYPLFK